jgi:hypothetical protein
MLILEIIIIVEEVHSTKSKMDNFILVFFCVSDASLVPLKKPKNPP